MPEDYWKGPLEKVDEYRWRVPTAYKPGMKVDGIAFADAAGIEAARRGDALEQLANSACLPGIQVAALAMPDIHSGYGFPIGGVGATDAETGVITPGGIGFDINCGVRLLRTNLSAREVTPHVQRLVDRLYRDIPSGTGSKGPIKLDAEEVRKVLEEGAAWAVRAGYGSEEDLEYTEERGRMNGADARAVSERAIQRGMPQLGTMGSGNHFLEIQVVEEVIDPGAAQAFGLYEGQVVIMIHSGSRGLGHQVCTDYLESMQGAVAKYGISVPDRQLACAPLKSPEGARYFAAMACAANFAWANRQCIMHWTRQAVASELGSTPSALGMTLLYDVCHNIAKLEDHVIQGRRTRVLVHRKGATRAFPPGHPDVPAAYRRVGQPVIVPGDMGRNSYVLLGTERAMQIAFGSTCHGAGRLMSRNEALRNRKADEVREALREAGVYARAASRGSLVEEAPEAYKDVNDVVNITHKAGISLKVAKLRPLGVVKG
ncbi:MAG: RtcB family protein [Firmicutes bacterium]|jgi:tRNA-splicing ligase RtcB|nr:RtcB family protein [Bacillota bacterium]